jgi:hypothetical protein
VSTYTRTGELADIIAAWRAGRLEYRVLPEGQTAWVAPMVNPNEPSASDHQKPRENPAKPPNEGPVTDHPLRGLGVESVRNSYTGLERMQGRVRELERFVLWLGYCPDCRAAKCQCPGGQRKELADFAEVSARISPVAAPNQPGIPESSKRYQLTIAGSQLSSWEGEVPPLIASAIEHARDILGRVALLDYADVVATALAIRDAASWLRISPKPVLPAEGSESK